MRARSRAPLARAPPKSTCGSERGRGPAGCRAFGDPLRSRGHYELGPDRGGFSQPQYRGRRVEQRESLLKLTTWAVVVRVCLAGRRVVRLRDASCRRARLVVRGDGMAVEEID